MGMLRKSGQSPGTVEERVRRFLTGNGLDSSQSPLLVAVSGGPDSVCLLHVLVQELDIKLHIAHLDHQLRGAESEADARYVAWLAAELDVPVTIGQRDVKAFRAREHLSLEEAAREVRYSFLAEVAKSIGAEKVAVAHTADDNVETILMHLIRGTGSRGLCGLQSTTRWPFPGGNLTIVRPLLQVTRQETLGYCQQHQLEPRSDSTNLSLSPLRNRIRHQLLPLLQGYNHGINEALLRMASLVNDDLAFLDKEAARLRGSVVHAQGNTLVFNKQKFLEVPMALKRHLLRRGIEQLTGGLKDIEARHIEEIVGALSQPAGRRFILPDGLVFAIEYDRYLLGADPAALSPLPVLSGEFAINIPGETSIPGWHIRASESGPEGGAVKTERFTACFDRDSVGNELIVRHHRPGDRFQPLGMNQPKKLAEFMIDAKIPRAWRQRVPLVSTSEQVLWVVGWRIDDRTKITATTRKVLRLEFQRL
ncbi:MAG: tRNA lysidine(34) synthetase TilS [Chloroflexota bacterium]